MMKKLIVSLTMVALPFFAMAGAKPGNMEDQTGIVTPDIATGFRQYTDFNNDTNGNMVICLESSYGSKCPGGWKSVSSVVPAGRTFVGIKVVNGRYGSQLLQVWWK
jgi:hypothetical protein